MPKFSIIIPVRYINDYLKENIKCIKALTFKDFEVLIVTDELEKFDFEGDTRFKIISSGKVGPSDKRNIAGYRAKGSILAFLDDDAFPAIDWLTCANTIFENDSVYALGGPAMTPPNASFLELVSGRIMESPLTSGGTVFRHIPDVDREIDDYPSVNLFVRKSDFEAVGGFTTAYWPGEDTKLCLDLVKLHGRKFVYSPLPIVYHHRRTVFKPHLKQVSRYGQHRGQFARIFPETSRVPMYFVPSMFLFGLVFGAIFCYFYPVWLRAYFSVITLYFLLLFEESLRVMFKDRSLEMGLYVFWGIFLTHIVYGYNFMYGFLVRPKLVLKSVDTKTGNYNEG